MNKYVLLIPCVIAMAGCRPEPAKPPVGAEPSASAVSSAPVAASAVVGQAVATVPLKKEASVTVSKQPSPVKKSVAPVGLEQKPFTSATEPFAPAPAAPAPKAETVMAPAAAEAKPQAGVSESEALTLAKKKNCFACHLVDKKVVGPAWKDVAAKYRGDAGAQARLENKIAKGGSGAWGSMAMPAQPQVSEAERTLLVRFILNLK